MPKQWSSVAPITVEWDDGHTTETWVPAVMLTDEFVRKLVDKIKPDLYIPEVGDRVKIPSIGIKGTVNFVSRNDLFFNHYFPVQVILDEPYDESGHKLYRTNLVDIKKLGSKKDKPEKTKKKKVKPAPPPPPVEEEDDILWDDDEVEWD